MDFPIQEVNGFRYIETGGNGEPIVLLHGLFGALSNFEHITKDFSKDYNILIPILPIYDLPILQVSVSGLVDSVARFISYKGFDKVHVLGNSLGGHIALL